MRRLIRIVTMLAIMLGICVQNVEAKEDERIKVNITSYDGQSIMIMEDHELYSSVPVLFTVDGVEGAKSYSISVDGGSVFGEYVPVDGAVTLYPDDETSPDGKWQIKFKNEEDDGTITESGIFRVSFDVTPPGIELSNADDLTRGEKGVPARFCVSDDSGVSRVIVKCADTVIKEIHPVDGEVIRKRNFEIDPSLIPEIPGTIEAACIDFAGNSSVVSFEYRNKEDENVPKITAEGIADGTHMSCNGTLELNVSDEEGSAYLSYVIKRQSGDEVITTECSGIEGGTELSFDEDGVYDIRAFATDEAGNRSEEIHRDFTIDMTAPVVEIGGVYENADIRNGANITVDVSENIPEETEVYINLVRRSPGKTEQIPISAYKPEAFRDIRKVDISADGEYFLEVSAEDGAGNKTECSKQFRIDSTAPDISISGLDDGEVTSDIPTLRFCAGELFYESAIMTAVLEKKEKDGYVPAGKSEQVMKSERDHVDIKPAEEGEYRLTCTASDRSGNTATDSVCFAIDHTPPVISGLGKIDNAFFKAFTLPGKLMDLVSDSSKVTAGAYIDDKEIHDGEEIISEGKYVLTILAEDEAGNAAEGSAVFMVDHTSPQIVLSGFDREGNIQKGSLIKVSLLDEGDRLTNVVFNGRDIAIDSDNTATVAVNDYGQYALSIKAEDEAGNVTDSEIHTSCYMNVNPFGSISKVERTVSSTPVPEDYDFKGMLVGIASVLSGTIGLTYRALYGDR